MLETPHVAVGAAIAYHIPNPLISIPLAFTSHFLLEKVPHWNPHINTELSKFGKITNQSKAIIVIDVLFALVVGIFIASKVMPDTTHASTILFASFASTLPDVIEGPYFFLNYKTKMMRRWVAFQKSLQNDTTPLPGILTQLITLISALWWVN